MRCLRYQVRPPAKTFNILRNPNRQSVGQGVDDLVDGVHTMRTALVMSEAIQIQRDQIGNARYRNGWWARQDLNL